MPESVDSPAPERTTASPSARRSVRASRPVAAGSRAEAGATLTPPWCRAIGRRAASCPSAPGDLPLERLEHPAVDPDQSPGREPALEEAADAARSVPQIGRAHV